VIYVSAKPLVAPTSIKPNVFEQMQIKEQTRKGIDHLDGYGWMNCTPLGIRCFNPDNSCPWCQQMCDLKLRQRITSARINATGSKRLRLV
jgi:hypothetical protein